MSTEFPQDQENGQLLPRPARRQRRPKEDRGLPPDNELATLAAEYLKRQRKHWPELAKAGLLPEPTPAVTAAMVEDFKRHHRTGVVLHDSVGQFASMVDKFGASYGRYSCDNSKPTSTVDQTNCNLDKAASEKRFIPWSYVFADYSVSGLDASRVGYCSLKNVIEDESHKIDTLYIDDFSRASRDELEWWRLAYFIKKLRKRLIGSSDGFDLNSPMGELMVGMFAILSKLFVKQLREKVGRGMKAAADRGTVLGKLKLGFTRRIRQDEDGRDILNPDGTPATEPCIDPETAAIVREIVDMFLDKKLSAYRIVQILNERKANNWDGWTECVVWDTLRGPELIGAFIWNRFRTEYDHETERRVKVENSHSEWKRKYDKSLALISLERYRSVRRRLSEISRRKKGTKRAMTRNQVSATTLCSGTLVCGYCGHELVLFRSGKYKQLFCPNGTEHARGCKLTSSKSTRIIEGAVLGFLRDRILTTENVAKLVAQANTYLAELAAEPPADVKPLKAEMQKLEQKIKRLVKEMEDEGDAALRRAIRNRAKELRGLLDEKTKKLREVVPMNGRPIKPIDEAMLLGYLDDIRALLNQEVPAAADALRNLTGPISITQQPHPAGGRRAIWMATFTPKLAEMLTRIAKDKDCPDSMCLELLCQRIWTISEPVELLIDHVPQYERVAPQIAAMLAEGHTPIVIQRKLNIPGSVYHHAVEYWKSGQRPKLKPTKRPRQKQNIGKGRRSKYKDLAGKVAQLHDEQKLAFAEIARRLS
ncbi:MAG: recombinase family protein, partial [Candidatus Sulfotelmatobacter sp.]